MNRYSKIVRGFPICGLRLGPFKTTLAATAALVVGMCLAVPTPSQAITTGICGPVHSLDAVNFGGVQIGFCAKSVTLSNDVLTITLTNTSLPANGGFIVADAFSVPAGSVTLVSTSDPDFVIVLNGAVVVAPFTNTSQIISLGGTLANAFETFGGAPNLGIGVGNSVTFVFHLSSTTGATEQGIFDSELIRFSGFDNVGAPGDRTSVSLCTDSQCTQAPVPELSTFWLLGTGLIGGGYWIRRRMIVESVLRGLS